MGFEPTTAWTTTLSGGVGGCRGAGRLALHHQIRPLDRIRDVVQGPDGAVYLLTDGSGAKLLKLTPAGVPRGQKENH